jgi:polysaccharide export outer membrane protein
LFVSPSIDAKQAGSLPALTAAAPYGLRLILLALVLAAAAFLSGCTGSRGGPIPYNVKDFRAPDAPSAMVLEDDYKIAPLDTLKVTVFQVPDLSGDFDVDLTGHISLPLIGSVKAVDLTTSQLDTRLTQMLGEKYLQSPDVSVGVKSSSTRVVTVDGSVRNPGVFPVNGPMTLLRVIALAQGTNEDANPRRVAVFRQIEGQRMAAAFDLTSIRRGNAEDPRIYSGDIVVVDGSSIKAMQREILQTVPLLTIFRPF